MAKRQPARRTEATAVSPPPSPPCDPDIKVLLWSNAPWIPTGYGQQAAQMLQSWAELGVVADMLNNFGAFGGAQELPTGGVCWGMGNMPPFGEDRLPSLLRQRHYDVVVTLANCWAMERHMWGRLRELAGFDLWSYDPVERWPMTSEQRAYYEVTDAKLIPMTEWAAGEADRQGIERFAPIPHTLWGDYTDDGDAPRDLFGLPDDRRIVGMVGANSGAKQGWLRKGYETAFLALRELRRRGGYDDVMLWCHTAAGDSHSGTDLTKVLLACGLTRDDVRFTPPAIQYAPLRPVDMAHAYRCMDVFVNPHKAEGFGVPIIEAQACGTPVVATGTCGTPEIVVLGSLLDRHNAMWDATQNGMVDVPSHDELADHIAAWLETEVPATTLTEGAAEVRRRYGRESVRDTHWRPQLAHATKGVADWSSLDESDTPEYLVPEPRTGVEGR